MFLLKRLSLTVLSLGLLLVGSSVRAQEPQNQNKVQAPTTSGSRRPFGRGEGRGFRHGPGPRGAFGPGVLRELNLTDDQRQQIRKIVEQSREVTRAQREEVRQLGEKRFQGTLTADEQARARTLHEQVQTSMRGTESKIAAVLTAEQKAKVEELMKERKANRERFGRRRDGFPPANQGTRPSQKPTAPPA
jgi:protein CpxP